MASPFVQFVLKNNINNDNIEKSIMKRDLEQAIEYYKEKTLPQLPKRIEGIRSKDTYLDYILSGRSKKAKAAFIEAEKSIISRLNQCTCVDEVSDICYKTFGSIPGIGQQTISDYIQHALSVRGIDPEANCYDILTRSAKSALKKRGYNIAAFKESILFKDFDSIAFVDFANKHYRSFSRIK